MVRGRLRAEGTPEEVLRPDLVEEVFGVRAVVVPHPEFACPLVVTLGPSSPSTQATRDGGVATAASSGFRAAPIM
jgi:iron complex transport system ATP-binding protein